MPRVQAAVAVAVIPVSGAATTVRAREINRLPFHNFTFYGRFFQISPEGSIPSVPVDWTLRAFALFRAPIVARYYKTTTGIVRGQPVKAPHTLASGWSA